MRLLRLLPALVTLVCLTALAWAEEQAPVLAIIGVGQERQSPQLQSLQDGLVHLVQSEVGSRSAAHIVSRTQTALFLDELGMGTAQLTEPQTGQRFGSALSADYLVLVELSGDGELTASVSVTQMSSGEQVGGASFVGSAGALALLASEIGGTLAKALDLPPTHAAAPGIGPAPTIAVLDFRSGGSAGPLDRHLSDLPDLLCAKLSALDVLLVERQKLGAVLAELGLSASGLVRSADMAQVGRLLGAERMLDTTLIAGDSDVTLNSQLLQPETGLVVASCQVSGPAQQLPALVQELAMKVVSAAHVPVTEAGRAALAQQATGSLEAAFHAATGWRLGCENRPEDAVRELQQAVYLDPGLASAWEDLARQYETLQDYRNWAECARRFFPAAEGKAGPETFAAMAVQLANAEMWQQHFAEEEAAARLGLSYEPRHGDLHERLIIALARQGKAREIQAHCESVYRQDKPPYYLTYSVYVFAIHWLGYGIPSEILDEMVEVEFEVFSRGLDIFDRGVPHREFRFGIVMPHALVQACGAMAPGGAGIRLAPPLRHAEESLSLARRMTTYTDRPWTSGRGWFVAGLIEYKLGHGKAAEAALLRCLTYPNVNYDFDSYGYLAPSYGMVYYLLGHTYQDLLKDRERAIECYQQARFWIIPSWEAAHDSRAQLAALGASPARTDWRHTLGTCGPVLAKTYRDQLITWLPAHGYYMGFQFESQEVQRREEGVQLLPWEGRLSDVPTANDLRAYVAGGGSLLILLPPQDYNELVPPVMSGSAESLDVTLDWLLPAFGMGLSHHVSIVQEPAPLLPANGPPTLTLGQPSYSGTYFSLEVPEGMSLLYLQRPGQPRADTVAAIAGLGLGKVAVVSLQEWFPARNIYLPLPPAWQSQLMQGIMDWLSAPAAENQPEVARHWGVARNLVALGDCGASVQELDKVGIGTPSGPDARYWAGCLLADKLGDTDGAARRWREVIASDSADTWLVRMAHLRLGIAAVRAGDERSATPELTHAAGEQPDGIWGQAWVTMGDLKLMQADYLGAAQTFRKVADELGHCEERFRALFGLAYAFDKQGKPEAAARVYDAIAVEFGKAPLPVDMDTRWPDPWPIYYPLDARGDQPTVADAVAAARVH